VFKVSVFEVSLFRVYELRQEAQDALEEGGVCQHRGRSVRAATVIILCFSLGCQ